MARAARERSEQERESPRCTARRYHLRACALITAAVLLAACGRSGYQYVENADDTVFIKIPEDWKVVSEGTVNWILTPDEEMQPIPGEFVLPWRAEFDAAPGNLRSSSDYVRGSVEIQPVDRRIQERLSITAFFPELFGDQEGVEQVLHHLVTVGEVSGDRFIWREFAADGREIVGDRLVLTDSINSVVYSVNMWCSVGCYNANAASIEEVMSTFTVQG